MDIKEIFYWTASIALILLGLFIVALFAFLFYIKRLAERTAEKILSKVDDMSDAVGSVGRTWRNLTLTRFIIKAIRYLI